MREIRKYEVFKRSHQLVLDVYRLSSKFPQIETYGLVAQMRRAAYSIPMNLAEGAAREGGKEFAQFVNIAIGSCEELRYQLFLAKDLSYIGEKDYRLLEQGYESIKRMLTQLYKKLRKAHSLRLTTDGG